MYTFLCGGNVVTNFQKRIGIIILIVVVPFAAWALRTHLDENIVKATAMQKELEKVPVMPEAVQTSYSI